MAAAGAHDSTATLPSTTLVPQSPVFEPDTNIAPAVGMAPTMLLLRSMLASIACASHRSMSSRVSCIIALLAKPAKVKRRAWRLHRKAGGAHCSAQEGHGHAMQRVMNLAHRGPQRIVCCSQLFPGAQVLKPCRSDQRHGKGARSGQSSMYLCFRAVITS